MIDPSIALSVRPPQFASPLEAYGKAMSLQSMANNQKLQQAQLTGVQQENQMRQLQMQDQQAMRQAFQSWDGKNPDDLFSQAQQKGVSPQTLLKLKESLLDQKTKYAALDKETRANQLAKNTAIQSALAPVTQETDLAKQAQMWNQASQGLVNDGTISQQEAAQHPYPGSPDAVVSYVKGLNLEKWSLSQQQTGTANQRNASADQTYSKMISDTYAGVKNADDLNAANLQLMQKLPGKYANQLLTKYDPAAVANVAQANLTAKDRSDMEHQREQEAGAAADRTERVRHDAVTEGQGSARIGIEQTKLQLDQGAIMRTAQSLATGDLTSLKDVASLRGDQRLQIYDLAKQINPNFNTSEVDRKIKTEDYYANGKGANNLQSFGTFLEHGGAASDAVNNIRLSNTPIINKPLNWWKKNMSGDPSFTNLMTSLEPVRKEFEKFLLGGQALYGEDRKAAEKILNDDSSPAQIQAALKTMGHTAEARFHEENYRYKKVIGHDLTDPFSPEAVQGAQKIGINLPSATPAAPNPTPNQPAPTPAPLPKGNGTALTNPVIVKQFLDAVGGDKVKARALAQQNGWKF